MVENACFTHLEEDHEGPEPEESDVDRVGIIGGERGKEDWVFSHLVLLQPERCACTIRSSWVRAASYSLIIMPTAREAAAMYTNKYGVGIV